MNNIKIGQGRGGGKEWGLGKREEVKYTTLSEIFFLIVGTLWLNQRKDSWLSVAVARTICHQKCKLEI